jgi:hypothetical protein
VVERTFAWLGKNRRLSKDYEQDIKTSESMIYIGMTRLMLRKVSKRRRFCFFLSWIKKVNENPSSGYKCNPKEFFACRIKRQKDLWHDKYKQENT